MDYLNAVHQFGSSVAITRYAKIIIDTLIPKNDINIVFDLSKPNGTPRKVLDVSKAKKYGWVAKTKLKESILKTYIDFKRGE